MIKPRCYISGPITGVTNHEYSFAVAEDIILSHGIYAPVSPVKIYNALKYNLRREPSLRDICLADCAALIDCEAILMLPGWERSAGCQWEHRLAVALSIKIFYHYITREEC